MSAGIVMVGYDGSPNAQVTLDRGIEEARVRGSSLLLVGVHPILEPGGSGIRKVATVPGYATALEEAVETMLDEAAEYVCARGISVDTAVEGGSPSAVLVKKSHDVDLVVIGARGRGGFIGRLLGGVAAAVPAHAACPVLVVPPAEGDPNRRRPADAYTEADYTGHIVVGVDVTGKDNPALYEAATLAANHGLPLGIVGVLQVDFGRYEWLTVSSQESPISAEVAATLDECVSAAESHASGISVTKRVVISQTRDRTPAVVLSGISATAEMTVVGSRGRGGVAGLLLGSTSQRLLHLARGPVMTVRS